MYLGHVIGVARTSPEPEKTVKEWPVPKTMRDVRSFNGFANYYRIFTKNFASIDKHLQNLTKKSARVEWTPLSKYLWPVKIGASNCPRSPVPRLFG